MGRLSRRFLTFAVVVGCLMVAAQAQGEKKRNNQNNQARNQQKQMINKGIQAHKNAAETAKAVRAAAEQNAQIAAYKAQSAQQEIETAKAHIDNLEAAAEQAVVNMQQIEQSIVAAQQDDSRLTKALAYVAETQEKYGEVRRKLFNSPAYKAAYQRALASPDKARDLPEVRKTFIEESSELQIASSRFDTARKQLEVVRAEVLGSDDRWVTAVNEVRSTKEALASSQVALKNALLGKSSASSIYRNHAATAAAAAAQAQRSESSIKNLQSQQKKIQQQQQRENQYNQNRNRTK